MRPSNTLIDAQLIARGFTEIWIKKKRRGVAVRAEKKRADFFKTTRDL
jgi:hypothetical protein